MEITYYDIDEQGRDIEKCVDCTTGIGTIPHTPEYQFL